MGSPQQRAPGAETRQIADGNQPTAGSPYCAPLELAGAPAVPVDSGAAPLSQWAGQPHSDAGRAHSPVCARSHIPRCSAEPEHHSAASHPRHVMLPGVLQSVKRTRARFGMGHTLLNVFCHRVCWSHRVPARAQTIPKVASTVVHVLQYVIAACRFCKLNIDSRGLPALHRQWHDTHQIIGRLPSTAHWRRRCAHHGVIPVTRMTS